MSRRPARFTEADMRRALKVAEKSPTPMAVEILPDGTIRFAPINPGSALPVVRPEDIVL